MQGCYILWTLQCSNSSPYLFLSQILLDYIECHKTLPSLFQNSSNESLVDRLEEFDHALRTINRQLPSLFIDGVDKPMDLQQRAALEQMLMDVQKMTAQTSSRLRVSTTLTGSFHHSRLWLTNCFIMSSPQTERAPIPSILPEADKLRLLHSAARERLQARLEFIEVN